MTIKPHRHARPAVRSSATPHSRSGRIDRRWLFAGATVAGLAATALFNRAATKRAEAAHPPVGSFVEVDGVRLHYADRGTGPVVVLLHGNGVTLDDYAASGVLDLAAERHRVLAFDRPGFGYSGRPRTTVWTPQAQARLIAIALDTLGIADAVVVGHSWGAMVALAMAQDHSRLVRGLVLLSGYYYPTIRADAPFVAIAAIPGLGDVLVNTVSPLTMAAMGPAAVKASFSPAPVSDKFADFPAVLALRPGQLHAMAADSALMIPAAAALARRYGEITVPVAIMAGEGDRIAQVDTHARRLAEDITGSTLLVVPEQGHLFHYAVPERVVTAIAAVEAKAGKVAY